MRVGRLVVAAGVGAAIFALPAYAVVIYQTGAARHAGQIHLVSGGIGLNADAASDEGSSIAAFPAGSDDGSSIAAMPAGSDDGSSIAAMPGSDESWIPGISSSGTDSSAIGMSVAAVPELSSWWMMLGGFFAIGAVRYRSVRKMRNRAK
jgi:hypothetical protein